MKVKNDIIKKIRESASLKRELLYKMGWSETTLYRYLRENSTDGDLTKASALKIISTELEISESEILTDE